jgi:ABC-2 type transport system permease protein
MTATTRLIRAELLKARTTRTVYGLAVGVLAGVALAVVSSIIQLTHDGGLDTSRGVRNILTSAGWGVVLMLVFGIMTIAGEFRHKTIITTLLITPSRPRVVAVKLAAVTVVGAVFGLLAATTTLAITVPWLLARHVEGALIRNEAPLVFLGVLLATMLYGIIGVAVGSLIRNQTLAIVIALVWLLLVENLVVGIAPAVGKWLPAGAASGLMRNIPDKGHFLAMPAGGGLLAAYATALAITGAAAVVRRDVA